MSNLREAAQRRKDLNGQKFGRLSVAEFDSVSIHGQAIWRCICDCGTERKILANSLTAGKTVSCGCYFRDTANKSNLKHGLGRTKTANIWRGMKQRCNSSTSSHFKYYGGRGITVCERWQDYLNFLADMGECPEGHSIDRIDPDGDYTPENCRWIPQRLQARTTRKALRFEGKPLAQIAEETGVHYDTLYYRLKKHGTPFKESNHVKFA